MNIKLSVKKETFQLYLQDIGYNYKIKQYDDFIQSFGRYIKREIIHAMTNNNLVSFLNKSFDKPLDMGALEDIMKIDNIKQEYFKRLIESGVFDLYLNEKEILFPENIKEEVYLRERMNNLTIEFNDAYFMQDLEKLKNKNLNRRMRNLKAMDDLNIHEDKKIELDKKIKNVYINKFHGLLLRNYSGPEMSIDKKIADFILKEITLDKPLYQPTKLFYIWIKNEDAVLKNWERIEEENKRINGRGLPQYISNLFGREKSQIVPQEFQRLLLHEINYNDKVAGPLMLSKRSEDERFIDIDYQLFVQIDLNDKKYKIYLEDSDLV